MYPATQQVGHLDGDVKGRSPARYKIKGSVSLTPQLGARSPRFLSITQKDGNRRVGTFSAWIRRRGFASGGSSGLETLLAHQATSSSANYGSISILSDNRLFFSISDGTAMAYQLVSDARFEDCSRFYHVLCHWDTTQENPEHRMRMFVDGKEIETFNSRTNPPLNYQGKINNAAYPLTLGHTPGLSSSTHNYASFNGEMADIAIVDGLAMWPKDFGYFDELGNWRPDLPSFDGWGPNSLFLTFEKKATNISANMIRRPSQHPPGEKDSRKPVSIVPTPGIASALNITKPENHTASHGAYLSDSLRGDGYFSSISSSTGGNYHYGEAALAPNAEDEHLRFKGSWNWEKRSDNEVTYWRHYLWARGPEHGFDMVQYQGTGKQDMSFPHSLGRKPELAIILNQAEGVDYPGYVWAKGFTDDNNDKRLNLNNGSGVYHSPGSSQWRNDLITDTAFGVGVGATNHSSYQFQAYLFASVPGKSQYFKWQHRGANAATRFECGFRPRFFLWKIANPGTETADQGAWVLVDNRDGTAFELDRNRSETYAYNTSIYNPLETDDTGFTMRHPGTSHDFIIMAFADETDINRCCKSLVGDMRARPINFDGVTDISDATPDDPGLILSWTNANRWSSSNAGEHQGQRVTNDGGRLELSYTRSSSAVGVGLPRAMPESGKWYFEVDSCYTFILAGYQFADGAKNGYDYYDYVGATPGWKKDGQTINGRRAHYISLDMDARIMYVETSQGKRFALPIPERHEVSPSVYQFFVASAVATLSTAEVNFGQRPFVNGLPEGHRPLKDLGSYQERYIEPSSHFKSLTYRGLHAGVQDMSDNVAWWGVRTFKVDGETYMARRKNLRLTGSAAVSADWVSKPHVEITKWNPGTKKFEPHHKVTTTAGGYQIDIKEIDGEIYLAQVAHYDGDYAIRCSIHKWDRARKQFSQTEFSASTIPSGPIGTALFDIDADHFGWVVASHRNSSTFDVNSVFFKIEKATGVAAHVQHIPTHGGHSADAIEFEGEQYITMGEYRNGAGTLVGITQHVWKYDPGTNELVAAYTLPNTGPSITHNKMFVFKDRLYVIAASRYNGTNWSTYSTTRIYRLSEDKTAWEERTSFGTLGVTELDVHIKGDAVYIGAPSYYNGTTKGTKKEYLAFQALYSYLPDDNFITQHSYWQGRASLSSTFVDVDDGNLYYFQSGRHDNRYDLSYSVLYKVADKGRYGYLPRFSETTQGVIDSVKVDDADGEYILSAQHVLDGSNPYHSSILIYTYDPSNGSLARTGEKDAHGVYSLDAIKWDGTWYVMASIYLNGSGDTAGGSVVIYKWDEVNKTLEVFEGLPCPASIESRFHVQGSKLFGVAGSYASGGSYNANSKSFEIDVTAAAGSRIINVKDLATSGARGIDIITHEGETLMYIGGAERSDTTGTHTSIYKWLDATESWALMQTRIQGDIAGKLYGRWFVSSGKLYLLTCADSAEANPTDRNMAALYRYAKDTGQVTFIKNIFAVALRNFEIVEHQGEHYFVNTAWESADAESRGADSQDWCDNMLMKFDPGEEDFFVECAYPAHRAFKNSLYVMNDGRFFAWATSMWEAGLRTSTDRWHELIKGGINVEHNKVYLPTDFLWLKNYNQTTNSHKQFSKKVSLERQLTSDSNALSAFTNGAQLLAEYKDGVTLAYSASANYDGAEYLAAGWKASPESGFAVTEYTGNGTDNHAVPYELGGKKSLFNILKCYTASSNWIVKGPITSDPSRILYLNGNGIATDGSSDGYLLRESQDNRFLLGNQDVSTDHVNRNGQHYMGLHFRSIEGQLEVGKYTGTGNADGPFIQLSFRPRWVLIKREDANNMNWAIWDSSLPANENNPMTMALRANLSNSGYVAAASSLSFLSGGFRITGTDNFINASGASYVFIAIADNPYGTTNPR